MSIRNVDLNSEKWRDLIFEKRNKEYGAYYLRKTSTRRHLSALLLVICGIIVIILLAQIIHFNRIHKTLNYEYEVKSIELSNLVWPEENIIINQVKAEEISQLKEIVKFTPPVIVNDEDFEQEIKELKEIFLSPDSIDTSSDIDEDILLLHKEITQSNKKEEYDIPATDEKNRNAIFQDGQIALLRYIYQNIQYPSAALKQRINGRVVCSFIVNEDGSVSDVSLLQGVYIFLDEEVLRVIDSMPLWNPALKDGKPVKVKYIMPVVFRLN